MSRLIGIIIISTMALIILRATGVQTDVVIVDHWVDMVMSVLSISTA